MRSAAASSVRRAKNREELPFRSHCQNPAYSLPAWRPLALLHSLGLQDAAPDLILLDRFEERAEIAFAEPLVTLALYELEENRADHGLGKDLEQHPGCTAFDDALAVDQNA